MNPSEKPAWLKIARELQAMSQTGLTYATDQYDIQRYRRLNELAAEIIAGQADLNAEKVAIQLLLETGYATPKVDVRGVVVRDGKLLLVQERRDMKWTLPGGWADVGDLPSDMVAREVWEESGFLVKARKVLGVYDANRKGEPQVFFHAYKIVFLCEVTGGSARPSDETAAVDFFDFDKIPVLSGQRTTPRILADIQRHLADPNLPACFD